MEKENQHGGARKNSGRLKGSGKYGEATKPVRIPVSCLSDVETMLNTMAKLRIQPRSSKVEIMVPAQSPESLKRPLFSSGVSAGFPSPADDFIEKQLDLNEHLVKHPSATFYVRATGDSMNGAGIFEGDILVVDRSVEAVSGKIVIAVVDHELTVKRLYRNGHTIELRPENKKYPVISFKDDMDLMIWGVVTSVIRKL